MNKTKSPSDSFSNTHASLAAGQDEDVGQLTPLCHPNSQEASFFSRVKHSFSSSPLGSILGQNSSTPARSITTHTKTSNHDLNILQDDSPALTPRCISTVKHDFTPIPSFSPTRSRSCTTGSARSDASTNSSSPSFLSPSPSASCFSPVSLDSHPTLATSTHESDRDDKWSPILTSPSEAQSTPPLTPATPQTDTALAQSPKSAYSQAGSQRSASISIRDDESASKDSYDKKGKKPAPPFPYDTLLADISGPSAPRAAKTGAANPCDDTGEWWGLEYTLEMSRRDSCASDTSSDATGEHSKSRESWAAIHRGTLSSLCENANFQDWQRWHRSLEKIELRRRRKRTIDFIEESSHLAGLYVDEVLAQRAVQIHEELLTEDEIYDALVWIEYAAERRPDPFFPPEKHNLGWVLKSHRSIASIRDLKQRAFDEE